MNFNFILSLCANFYLDITYFHFSFSHFINLFSVCSQEYVSNFSLFYFFIKLILLFSIKMK